MITTRSPSFGRRWFADENLLGVAKALEAVNVNIVYPGHPACPNIPKSTADEDWIPFVAVAGWPIFTQDETIRHKQSQRELIRKHGATVFFLEGANETSWDKLRLIARHWDKINHITGKTDKTGSRLHKITKSNVRQVRF